MKPISQRLLALATRRDGQPDRGALANLRRGLSKATRHLAWAYLDELGITPDDEPGILTAALFAEHQQHSKSAGNLGATWRKVYDRRRRPKDQKPDDPEQMRLRRLIACDAGDLPDHLLAVVRFAKQEGVDIDYDKLFRDLREWFGESIPDDPKYPVKLRWACGFHQASLVRDESPNESAQTVSQ